MKILFAQESPCIRNYKIATALRSQGHKVTLVYSKAKLSQMYTGLSDNVYNECVQIKSHRQLWDLAGDYDLIHCHNEPDVLTVVALACDVPVIHDTHDLISLRANGDPGLAFFEGIANRGAAGRIYSTPYQRAEAEKMYGAKGPSLVFYNYASEGDLPKTFLPKLSAQDSGVHIVYEGGIGVAGHRNFSSLFVELAERDIHIHIYPTFYNQDLAAIFSRYPTIYYNNPVSPKEIMGEMTQYDIGIIPFNLEKGNKQFLDSTIANKLCEYLAAGLPVVTSPLRSYINYFNDNLVGMVFQNADDLIAKLPALSDMASNVDFSEHVYTYEGEIGRLETFYAEIIGDKPIPIFSDVEETLSSTKLVSEDLRILDRLAVARDHWAHRGVLGCYFDEGPQSKAIVDMVAKLGKETDVKNVLEFGCNVGRNLHCLRRDVGDLDLLGIDINAEAIEAGKQRYNLPLVLGGEESLVEIDDDIYDVVFTVSTLDHIPKIENIVKDLLRVAKKYLIVLEPYNGKNENADEHATAEYSYFWDYPALFGKLGAKIIYDVACPLGEEGAGKFFRLYVIKQDFMEDDTRVRGEVVEITSMEEWDALVKQSPYALYSHSSEYNRLVFDGKLKKIKIVVGDEIYLVPLEIRDNGAWSFLRYYSGMIPVSTYEYIDKAYDILCQAINACGLRGLVLSYIEQPEHEFVKILIEHIKKQGGRTVEVERWTHASIMSLERSYTVIWNDVYDSKTRNMIRKAKKKGVECRVINILDHIDDVVGCTLSKPVRHGDKLSDYYYNPELYRKEAERWQEIYGDNMTSFGAFVDSKLIAYINTFMLHGEVIASNMLSHADYLDKAPNNAIFDFMYQWYIKHSDAYRIMYSFDNVAMVDKFKHSMGFEPVFVQRWAMQLGFEERENYTQWLDAMIIKNCNFLTADEVINGLSIAEDRPNIVIRHDIDFEPAIALKMAEAEHSRGIKSTFYAFTPEKYKVGFPVEKFQALEGDGWEIGYHVSTEDLDEALSDIERLKQNFDIRTAVPHMGNLTICKGELSKHIKILLDGSEFQVQEDGYIADNGGSLKKRIAIREDGTSEWRPITSQGIVKFVEGMEPGKIYHFLFHPIWYNANLDLVGNKAIDKNTQTLQDVLERQIGVSMSKPAIFIGGTGRSGTAILRDTLGKHRDIAAIPYETKLIQIGAYREFPSGYFNASEADRPGVLAKCKELWIGAFYRYEATWKTESDDDRQRGLYQWISLEDIESCLPLLDKLKDMATEEDMYLAYGRFLDAIFSKYSSGQGKKYWLEKSPANSIFASGLYKIFPNLKLINIIRDGRDVACSSSKMAWGFKDLRKGIDWWAAKLGEAIGQQRAIPADRYLNIRYEDLVHNTQNVLRKVVDFLGLDWDEALESVELFTTSVERWREELPEDLQVYAITRYGPLLKALGYDVKNDLAAEASHPDRVTQVYRREILWDEPTRENIIKRIDTIVAEAKGYVLDLGCSDGIVSHLLGVDGHAVVGIDMLPEHVAKAQELLKEMPKVVQQRVFFKEGRAEKLEYDDNTFDTVILGQVIEHVDDDKAVLVEAARVLKPDGVFLCSVPLNKNNVSTHKRWYTAISFRGLLSEFFVNIRLIGFGMQVLAIAKNEKD